MLLSRASGSGWHTVRHRYFKLWFLYSYQKTLKSKLDYLPKWKTFKQQNQQNLLQPSQKEKTLMSFKNHHQPYHDQF